MTCLYHAIFAPQPSYRQQQRPPRLPALWLPLRPCLPPRWTLPLKSQSLTPVTAQVNRTRCSGVSFAKTEVSLLFPLPSLPSFSFPYPFLPLMSLWVLQRVRTNSDPQTMVHFESKCDTKSTTNHLFVLRLSTHMFYIIWLERTVSYLGQLRAVLGQQDTRDRPTDGCRTRSLL